MKKWTIFVCVLSLLLSMAGCGAEDAEDNEITVDKMLLCYYHECCEVNTTGMEITDRGVEIGLKIENLYNRELRVKSRALSVNGYMLPNSGLDAIVSVGETARDVLYLSAADLAKAGIDTVAEISFGLDFYDADMGVILEQSAMMNLHTTAPMDYVQPMYDAGEVILAENDLRVVYKGLRTDEIWDGELVFHFDNGLHKDVTFYVENIAVNGIAMDKPLHQKLSAFTKCVDGVPLEEPGDVEIIEFTLRAVDNYGKELASTEMITLNVK